jgi:hypothetical protein
LRDETSRETRVSHGLARIVSARPPKTSFKTYFRHNNALIICLRQYSVLKIGLEFLARPGLRDETTVSRSRLGLVSQGLAARPNSTDSGLAQREKRHYYPVSGMYEKIRNYIIMGVRKSESRFFSPACGHALG